MLNLPIDRNKRYVTNTGLTITFTKGDANDVHLRSEEAKLWFSVETGRAPGTNTKIVAEVPPEQMSLEELQKAHAAMMERLKELEKR